MILLFTIISLLLYSIYSANDHTVNEKLNSKIVILSIGFLLFISSENISFNFFSIFRYFLTDR